jgi:hypothetical protein
MMETESIYSVLTKVPVGLLFVLGKASSDIVSTASNNACFERRKTNIKGKKQGAKLFEPDFQELKSLMIMQHLFLENDQVIDLMLKHPYSQYYQHHPKLEPCSKQ